MSTKKKSVRYLRCGLAWCNSWGRRRSRCRSGTVPMPTSPSEGSSSGHYPRRGRPRRARTRAGARLDASLQGRDILKVWLKIPQGVPGCGELKKKKKSQPATCLVTGISHTSAPDDCHLTGCGMWLEKRRQPERWLLSSRSPAVSPDISKCWRFKRARGSKTARARRERETPSTNEWQLLRKSATEVR